PREVVTVVHRLSGWKLLTWLAASGPPMLEVDNLPSALDVHTNIVAGFVHADGRKVVARLPQGGAELDPAGVEPPPGLLPVAAGDHGQSEFTLILGDGRKVSADFVGLDAATGLSLLEASEPLFATAGDEGHTEDPAVGQRVRLYAPAPVAAAPAPAAPAEEGVIYLGIDRADGRLTEVTRAPSGRPFRVTARADGVTPAWTGAVATNEAGALVGIVAQSVPGETQIVTGEMVRQAVKRVQDSRASVPQPWLGVRGDAAFRTPLENWLDKGWRAETALPLIQGRQGVLLTSVPPGTPAFAAGLRPGDVIARVGGRDLRTVEDLSLVLKELRVGSTADFTVWRSREPGPLKLAVLLEGTQNPALSTAEAEARAARESLLSAQALVREARLGEQKTGASESLRAAERRLEEAAARLFEAEARVAEARFGLAREVPARAAFEAQAQLARRPLQTYGLEVIGLTRRGAARLGARGGVLVVSVRPDSPAAASGLLAGDVIETVDGRAFTRLGFGRLAQGAGPGPLSLGVVRLKQRINVALGLARP
ncbi:MAG TPA: PDZ domain-containing protein, partial [Pyrinomonadaceae bacterium]|nr:PDZ domain-containing protein [Pyrinomonadaceae bacterium]